MTGAPPLRAGEIPRTHNMHTQDASLFTSRANRRGHPSAGVSPTERSSAEGAPNLAQPCRPGGWRVALDRAYAALAERDLPALIIRQTPGRRDKDFMAFFDDGLIVAEELGLSLAVGSWNFRIPLCRVPCERKSALIELSFRLKVLIIAAKGGIWHHELYEGGVCTLVNDAPNPLKPKRAAGEREPKRPRAKFTQQDRAFLDSIGAGNAS